jgi:hypothetical protein
MEEYKMNKRAAITLAALLLAPLAALHAAETTAAQQIDRETLDKWSAPYRGWYYQPDHVISADPKIPGHEDFKNADVPCVYQMPGQPDKWYMSFIAFNGKGYKQLCRREHKPCSVDQPKTGDGLWKGRRVRFRRLCDRCVPLRIL